MSKKAKKAKNDDPLEGFSSPEFEVTRVNEDTVKLSDISFRCWDNHCCCGECFNSLAGEGTTSVLLSKDDVIRMAEMLGLQVK